MPREATVHRDDQLDADAAGIGRAPGEFARHPKTGAPYVVSLDRLTDAKLRKAELVELCARHEIAFDPKATVPQLKALLGDLAKRGSKVQYGRPSGFGKYIELATAIQRNSERREALGLLLDPTLFRLLDGLDDITVDALDARDPALRDTLDKVAAGALDVGGAKLSANRGTWFHGVSEHVDRGESWQHLAAAGEALGIAMSVQAALALAYERAIKFYGFEIIAIEATCVDDLWRLAGTLDRIVRLTRELRFILPTGEIVVLPAGWVGILDLKTGALFLDEAGFIMYWRSYSVQCASYQQSRPYDTDRDLRGDWPEKLDDHWAIILHVDIRAALEGNARAQLVLVDLEAGRHAGALCVAAREWERRTDVFSIPTDDLCVSVPVEQIGQESRSSVPEERDPRQPDVASATEAEAQPGAASATVAIVCSRGGGCQTIVLPAVPTPPVVEQPAEEATPAASSANVAEHGSVQPPAADAQPAPVAAATGAMTDEEVRAEYFALAEDKRADVARMRDEHIAAELRQGRVVSKRDATAAALRWIQPFDIELPPQPAPEPKPLPERTVQFTGDEGDTVSEAEALEARGWIERLYTDDPEAFAEVRRVAKQADDAGVGFHILHRSTRRRWQIYRGLMNVARYGWADELVRDLLAAATGDDACRQPAIALGQIVGLLALDQAAAFADLAARLHAGSVVPVFADGRFTFHGVAQAEPALAGV
jgi:hypothetical protein